MNQTTKRRVIVALCIIAVYMASSGFRFSLPIRGRIVDDLGHPIAGAAIAASWDGKGFFGQETFIKVTESQSDNDGKFEIPGWGPTWMGLIPPNFYDDSPQIWVARRGYQPIRILNGGNDSIPSPRHWNLSSEQDLTHIRLDHIPELLDDRARVQVIGIVAVSAAMAIPTKTCTRALIPLLSKEMELIQLQAKVEKPTYFPGQTDCKIF